MTRQTHAYLHEYLGKFNLKICRGAVVNPLYSYSLHLRDLLKPVGVQCKVTSPNSDTGHEISVPIPTPYCLLSARKMDRYIHTNSTFVILKISVAFTVQIKATRLNLPWRWHFTLQSQQYQHYKKVPSRPVKCIIYPEIAIVPWFQTFDDSNSKFMDSGLPQGDCLSKAEIIISK